MKRFIFKSVAICGLMLIGVNQMCAQGFLKKLSKAADKVSSTVSAVTGAADSSNVAADTAAVKALKWDNIPVYHAEKRVLTFEDGTPKKNDDGSPMVRVFLVDQFNNVRSAEAVKEQQKKLNKAINNILLKVGGGAAVGVAGGLLASKGKAKGALIGGAVGAAAGLALSAKDIKAAKAQKKSLKQQEELIAKYQENTRDFIQVYEAVINYFGGAGEADHSIGNLTLLDSSTNRSYKNDVFPLKRKTILERTLSDVFIPLCTRKVFMKGFAESGDLLRWREVDKKAYTEEIINCICNYLKLEDADNEQ